MEEQFAKTEIRKPENIVYKKTDLMVDRPLSYCPGCGHGTAHRMLMEVIEEMDIAEKTIGVSPVGCSVLAYDFLDIDMLGAAHGRAPALATAIKRMWPNHFVFTYQGDGSIAGIGGLRLDLQGTPCPRRTVTHQARAMVVEIDGLSTLNTSMRKA